MSWQHEGHRLRAEARKIDKSIKLETKDNFICKFLAWFLFLVTFGKFKREDFLENYANAIGNYIFIPNSWRVDQVERVMPHEGRHARQMRWMGLGIHPLAGLPVAAIVYGLLFLPVFLSFGRFWMELDADKQQWRYLLERGQWTTGHVFVHATKRAETLSSFRYAWATWYELAYSIYIKAANGVIDEFEAKLG